MLGFLFAIPKTSEVRINYNGKQVYRANTNLEQISDWLTKILLGVGLTQMDAISNKIGDISQSMAKEMNLMGHEAMFISSLIVFYTVCGFLNGYLLTRIVLPGIFAKTDSITAEVNALRDEPLTTETLIVENPSPENSDSAA